MVRKLTLILFIVVPCFTYAQIALMDDIKQADLLRDKQLLNNEYKDNSFMIRSTQLLQSISPTNSKKLLGNIYWNGLTATYNFQHNSNLPAGFNEGSMYPSIGNQHRVNIATHISWKNFEFHVQPEWVSATNENPSLFLGNKEDGNYWARYYLLIQNNIDYYTRMGNEPINKLFLGQSYFSYHYKKIDVGASSENQWWGPGIRNSLLMTNEAPGFYHFFVKNNEPIATPIGTWEGKAVLGRLESPNMPPPEDSLMRTIWADGIAKKNKSVRHLEGFTIQWQPKWLPNIYVGYSYVIQSYILNRNIYGKQMGLLSSDRPKQQLSSFNLRIVLPKDHAEIYAEIGQPNQAVSPWRLFGDSVKTGFVVGARKLFTLGSKGSYLKLFAEFTQLQLMNPALVIDNKEPFGGPLKNSWYINAKIRQGYTHQGKMIGASIGPGSNSQSIGLSWHKRENRLGIFLERVVHNNDFYLYEYYGSAYFNRYYIDINKGIEAQWRIHPNLLLGASILQTNALNYRWVREEDPGSSWSDPSSISDKSNWLFNCSLKFNLHESH